MKRPLVSRGAPLQPSPKHFSPFTWLWLCLVLLLAGCEDGRYSGTFIFEGEHRLAAGDQIEGDLLVRAGQVEIAAGAQVDGTVYMLGGTMVSAGHIAGDLILLGGNVTLAAPAAIGGDVRLGGGDMRGMAAATVTGEIINSGVPLPAPPADSTPGWDDRLRQFTAMLLLAGIGALLVRSRPGRARVIGDAAVDHTLVSGATGVLLLLVLPVLLVVMAFTIILIPLVMVLGLLLGLALAYGVVVLGWRLGAAISRQRQWQWTPTVATFWGTLLLLTLFSLPYVGDGLLFVTVVLLLGALLLTRLGSAVHRPDPPPSGRFDPEEYARPTRGDVT